MQMAFGFHNGRTFLDLCAAEGVNTCCGFATPKEVPFMQMAFGFHSSCTFLDLYAAEGVNARGGFATRKNVMCRADGREQRKDIINSGSTTFLGSTVFPY